MYTVQTPIKNEVLILSFAKIIINMHPANIGNVSMKVFNHFIFFSFLTRFLFALLSTIICFIPLKNWATINSTFAPWEWVRKIDITTFLFIDLCSNAKVELLLTELKAHLRKYFTPVIGNIVEQTKNIIHVTWIPAKT